MGTTTKKTKPAARTTYRRRPARVENGTAGVPQGISPAGAGARGSQKNVNEFSCSSSVSTSCGELRGTYKACVLASMWPELARSTSA